MGRQKQQRAKEKRQRDQVAPPAQGGPPMKAKSRTRNFPPEFYDHLSKIWLTERAKRELDRRNRCTPSWRYPAPFVPYAPAPRPRGAKVAALARLGASNIAAFAADGGPDMTDVGGCPAPVDFDQHSHQCFDRPHRAAASGKRVESASEYDANLGQHLADHNINLTPADDRLDIRKKAQQLLEAQQDLKTQQALNAARRSSTESLASLLGLNK